jgi:ferredoxin
MKARLYITAVVLLAARLQAVNNQILSWNNLGMHCMDSDYSVFSILPPYNTIEAQLIVNGFLVTNGAGYSITYQAVADPTGSFNSTSAGKGNFFLYAGQLYGAALVPDQGLAGWNMPGVSNHPQAMLFEPTNQPAAGVLTPVNWWRAEGIPLTPYDDAGNKNPYPIMRLIARNASNQPVATNDIVLPISDEMDCRACHASGSVNAAKPAAGWVWDGIQERDFRLNILRLHDERNFASNGVLYAAALAARGFNPQGLYRGVVADDKPVLCAACHASEALGAPSYGTIPPLTTSVHGYHAHVMDPLSGVTLESTANRSACYRCHPGSTTKCLRGAMGGAIAADGSMEMQCQSCHGSMSVVGSPNRVGWFMEPNCAQCHTGTATSNNGQIRYASVFTDTNYTVRVPVNQTFSTQPNIPATGLSLYRFSAGHGGLQCEACHGSTHAEFPSIHANDNVRDVELQGHAGVMVECTACHVSMTVSASTATNGPHGMHPIGQSWVSAHHNYINGNRAQCQACHGTDYRGTVLSRVQGNRTLTASFDAGTVTLNLFRGALIGCYTCHNGPSDDSMNSSAIPTVSNVSGNTANSLVLNLPVTVTPATATLRIISQPANGSLGVTNRTLTYFASPGFVGADTFTYAAWDGSKNSLLATGRVTVVQGPYSLGLVTHVPTNYPAGWPVALAAVATVTNCSGPVAFDWNFGDGTPHGTAEYPTHVYALPGSYSWSVSAAVSNVTAQAGGTIIVTTPVSLNLAASHNSGQLSFAMPGGADALLEQSSVLGSAAQWSAVTNVPGLNGVIDIAVPSSGDRFYRMRQPW